MWFVISLLVFGAARLSQDGAVDKLLILVGVLLFHELGHYVGMVGLGYRDVRMFFIPFFGAAVAGKRGRASQTREAIVLLLGPVPGIIFGVSAAFLALLTHDGTIRTVSYYLLGINAFNLLPVAPLDGGRLASVLLFSRWDWTEKLFTLVAGVVVAAGAFAAHMPFLCIFGVFMVLGLPAKSRMLGLAARVRAQQPTLVNDPAALRDDETRALFTAVSEAWPSSSPRRAPAMGDWMTQTLELAARRAPSIGRTFALAAVWGFALFLSLVGLVVAAEARFR
jgi:hypothetical protein